jgi:rhodanese-related sulfurtransferase
MEVSRVTVDEVRARLDRGEPLVFVDARSAESWGKAQSQIPGSVRVPPDEVAAHAGDVPRGRAVITYCT